MNSLNRQETIFSLFISSSRPLSKEELDNLSGDDGEEDSEDFQFGFHTVASSKPKKQVVTLYHESSRSSISITSNIFVWSHPWLKVKILSNSYNKNLKYILQNGYFCILEYGLDDRPLVAPIALFIHSIEQDLNEAEREEAKKAESQISNKSSTKKPNLSDNHSFDRRQFDLSVDPFMTFVKQKHSSCPGTVRLSSFFDLLTDYESQPCISDDEYDIKLLEAKAIRRMVTQTESGGVLEMSLFANQFFRLGPLLFPRKIGSIIRHTGDKESDASAKAELQTVINQMLEQEPWKVGFSEIIYQKTKSLRRKWSGLEASLKSMKQAPFYFENLEAQHRDALHLYDVIKESCRRDGHTFLSHENVKRSYDYYNPIKYHHNLSSLTLTLKFLVKEKVLHRDMCDLRERFHLMRFWRAEDKITAGFKQIIKKRIEPIQINMDGDEFTRVKSDPKQLLASDKICRNPITVISGRGGTGKTEVVTTVLNALDIFLKNQREEENRAKEEELDTSIDDSLNISLLQDKSPSKRKNHCSFPEKQNSLPPKDLNLSKSGAGGDEEHVQDSNGFILYTAPTGKAASVMRKRAGRKAFTMHQILASYKAHQTREAGSEWKFGETKILAVDESSMVSLELFASLLSCLLKSTGIFKIVLLGDVLQLPSIDPGNFMSDIFTSLKKADSVVELTTNHRSEGSLIFENAHRVSCQQDPIFDRNRGFHLLTDQELDELPSFVRQGAENLEKVTRVTDLIPLHKPVDRKQLSLGKEELYLSLLRSRRREFDLEDSAKSQFIAFRRAECNVVNEFCCKIYNDHLMFGPPQGPAGSQTQQQAMSNKIVYQFLVGDKVMCTKNSDVQIFCDREDSDCEDSAKGDPKKASKVQSKYVAKTDRLMNGNVYLIQSIESTNDGTDENEENVSQNKTEQKFTQQGKPIQTFYELDDLGGEVIRPNVEQFRRFCKPAHAWALTIHKFQGSEADTVVYGVSDSSNETWQHVYTALTRGKKRVIIIGTWADLRKAVQRKPRQRQTSLREKVVKLVTQAAADDSDEELLDNEHQDQDEELFAKDDDFEQCLSQMTENDFAMPISNIGSKSKIKPAPEFAKPAKVVQKSCRSSSTMNFFTAKRNEPTLICEKKKVTQIIQPVSLVDVKSEDVFDTDDSFEFQMSQAFDFDKEPSKVDLQKRKNLQYSVMKDEDFENDESFEAGFSQMNETDFQIFTQSNDQHQKVLTHSTPTSSRAHPQASNHCLRLQNYNVCDLTESNSQTFKSDDSSKTKLDPQMSNQKVYREIIDADDSFEAELGQMTDFELDKADTDSESSTCTPNKVSKLDNLPDISKTPILSAKLKKKLNFH